MRYLIIVLIFIFVSCGDNYKVIPEDDLGKIIVESVVAESFIRNTTNVNPYDSLSYYQPILDKYGYSVEDLEYTIERMVQRKTNVFGQMMDRISGDVRKIKEVYERQGNMVRDWRKKVKNEVFDTLYFSPDSIRINSIKDLKMLDYRVPVNGMGEIIVKYNYKINPGDSNATRYMTYSFRDSISNKQYNQSNFWLNRTDVVKPFEKECMIRNSYKANVFEFRVMAYTSREENLHPNVQKDVDFYIDSVTVLYRPPYEEGEKRLLKKIGLPIVTNINYLIEDSVRYTIPFDTIFGKPVVAIKDSVRFTKKLPFGEDPKKRIKDAKKKN